MGITLRWKSFEHRIVAALKDMGFNARRTTSGRQGQEETADIEASMDGREFLVECKFTAKRSYETSRPIKLAWLKEVEQRAGREKIGLLIYNYPHRGYYAVIRLADLPRLMGLGTGGASPTSCSLQLRSSSPPSRADH